MDSLGRASDHALARRAGLGDEEAFSELFSRHFHPTYRYALRMLNGEDDLAEDAAQDAWVKIWKHLPDFRGDSRVQTWMFSIVAREVLSARRRRRPVVVSDSTLEAVTGRDPALRSSLDPRLDPATGLREKEMWQALTLALAELPWRQRAAWLLREFEDMSYDEIARVLGTSPTVVRGQLHRARRALATRMEEWR